MKTLILTASTLLFIANVEAGSSMKVEGTCSGKLPDGSDISYTYYSDFDGCAKKSGAAVNFTSGVEGLFTGKRSFTEKDDNYHFDDYQLTFANSTGNTTGKLTYTDLITGKKQSVTLQCEVRDYEYTDC